MSISAIVLTSCILLAIGILFGLLKKYGPVLYRRFQNTSHSTHAIENLSSANESHASNDPLLVESSESNVSATDEKTEASKKSPVKKGKKKIPTQSRLITDRPSTSSAQAQSNLTEPAAVQPKERLKSLDTFRGICIILMIFVNDGGGGYYFFEHTTWDGLYVADLVFPWFIWIMGVCIPLSIEAQRKKGVTTTSIIQKISWRTIKLIFIGLIINSSKRSQPIHLENLRFPGVLQRIALTYFFAACIYTFFCKTDYVESTRNSNSTFLNKLLHLIKDFTTTWKAWIIILFVLAFYFSIIFFLPVPGCPTGYLGPAGLHLNSKYPPECIGGATGYIDRLIFTSSHIYGRPTAKKVYHSGAFDPEGLLGCLPSLFLVWLGVQIGVIFIRVKCPIGRTLRLFAYAVLYTVIGGGLCGWFENEGVIPVNKNLWSISYVFVTTSFGHFLLLLIYGFVDILKWCKGTPVVEIGMNSIFLYCAHVLGATLFPWNYSWGNMNTHFALLVETLWGTILWIVVGQYMHSKNIFIQL